MSLMRKKRIPWPSLKSIAVWLGLLVAYFLSIPPLAVLTYLCCFPVWLLRIYISPVALACRVCPPPINRWLEAYLNLGM